MIGILVYCTLFVAIGFILTYWSEKSSSDKIVWLKEESETSFWLFIIVFISCVFVDPWISQVLASLFVGYVLRLYWVYLQLDDGETDDFETKE